MLVVVWLVEGTHCIVIDYMVCLEVKRIRLFHAMAMSVV